MGHHVSDPDTETHPFFRKTATFLALAGLLLSTASCAGRRYSPDLAQLYDRSAQSAGPDRNPIIVIPGALGTRLIEAGSDRVVWGAFGHGYASPRKADGRRLFALPMEEGTPLSELRDSVVTDGVLDRIQIRYGGLPIQMRAYFFILGALGAGGYRDEQLGLEGAIDYGDDHYTCFQFDYDWRRDNVENAARLHEFILKKRAYVQEAYRRDFGIEDREVQFDIVAHSMGALLTRYFLRYGKTDLPQDGSLPPLTWEGAALVQRVILVAPPNAGSLLMLQQLVEGRDFGPILPRYPATLLGTFPSTYQMLPRSRHGVLVDASDPMRPMDDIMDPELWVRMGWGLASAEQDDILAALLPEVSDPAHRRRIALEHLRKSLARGRQFAAALDRPAAPPEGLYLALMAGDSVPTPSRIAVHADGKLQIIAEGPGDGTILRSSALMDERLGGEWTRTLSSPIAWDHVTFLFSKHMDITKDRAFVDNVLYTLLEDPRSPGRKN